jgi:N-acyl-phosphatidylethanolamine-hydrolysing phospholipase D
MLKRSKRAKFRNLHPHSPHNFVGIVRWKLGLDSVQYALAPDRAVIAPSSFPAVVSTKAMPAGPDATDVPACKIQTPRTATWMATWIGHSTFLIQLNGINILTDPIFGDCQPLPVGRMRRSCAPGMPLTDLPPIHHVLVSHSHYDHLDAPAIRALNARAERDETQFWVPEGLSPWFKRRGIVNCRELAWGESATLSSGLILHCVPAQHGSARTLFDRNRSHWCGWVLESSENANRKVYFAGDTGYSPIFREIGAKFRGFDLSLIPIGCYNPRWLMQPVHLNPADAVQVHIDVRSKRSIACHWGTFRLADEPLEEPPALLAQELAEAHIDPASFQAIRPGESLEI